MPRERKIPEINYTSLYGEDPNRNRYLSNIHSRFSPNFSPTDHDLYVNDLSNPRRVRNLVTTLKSRQEKYWGQPFDHRLRMETDLRDSSYYTYLGYINGSLPHDKWHSIIQGNNNNNANKSKKEVVSHYIIKYI